MRSITKIFVGILFSSLTMWASDNSELHCVEFHGALVEQYGHHLITAIHLKKLGEVQCYETRQSDSGLPIMIVGFYSRWDALVVASSFGTSVKNIPCDEEFELNHKNFRAKD